MIVNQLNLNVKISGAGAPFVWGHGLMGSLALEDSVPSIDWERIGQAARVVRCVPEWDAWSRHIHDFIVSLAD